MLPSPGVSHCLRWAKNNSGHSSLDLTPTLMSAHELRISLKVWNHSCHVTILKCIAHFLNHNLRKCLSLLAHTVTMLPWYWYLATVTKTTNSALSSSSCFTLPLFFFITIRLCLAIRVYQTLNHLIVSGSKKFKVVYSVGLQTDKVISNEWDLFSLDYVCREKANQPSSVRNANRGCEKSAIFKCI